MLKKVETERLKSRFRSKKYFFQEMHARGTGDDFFPRSHLKMRDGQIFMLVRLRNERQVSELQKA